MRRAFWIALVVVSLAGAVAIEEDPSPRLNSHLNKIGEWFLLFVVAMSVAAIGLLVEHRRSGSELPLRQRHPRLCGLFLITIGWIPAGIIGSLSDPTGVGIIAMLAAFFYGWKLLLFGYKPKDGRAPTPGNRRHPDGRAR